MSFEKAMSPYALLLWCGLGLLGVTEAVGGLGALQAVLLGWAWIGFDGFFGRHSWNQEIKSCRRAGCVEWPCAGCNGRNTTAGNGTKSQCLGEGAESGSNAYRFSRRFVKDWRNAERWHSHTQIELLSDGCDSSQAKNLGQSEFGDFRAVAQRSQVVAGKNHFVKAWVRRMGRCWLGNVQECQGWSTRS